MPEFAATPGAVASFFDALRTGRGRLYLRPAAFVWGAEAEGCVASGHALRLVGGHLAFGLGEIIVRRGGGDAVSIIAPVASILEWRRGTDHPFVSKFDNWFAALTRPRPPVGGIPVHSGRARDTAVMGIVNVTPDSFSDGGLWFQPDAAIQHGEALLEAGAQVLDVGGESTRPGAAAVAAAEELRRVIPVVRALAQFGATVCIDTRNAAVMEAALEAGAKIINDVSALTHDPRSLEVAAKSGVPVILMHMQGTPETMQKDPRYDNAPLDVFDYLETRIGACEKAGIDRARIVVDPGIGFGKTRVHNAEILSHIGLYQGLGCAVMIGVSRKSFIAGTGAADSPDERLPGSLAAGLAAVARGVQMLRVHDVAETRQALAVWDLVQGAGIG